MNSIELEIKNEYKIEINFKSRNKLNHIYTHIYEQKTRCRVTDILLNLTFSTFPCRPAS